MQEDIGLDSDFRSGQPEPTTGEHTLDINGSIRVRVIVYGDPAHASRGIQDRLREELLRIIENAEFSPMPGGLLAPDYEIIEYEVKITND